MSRRRLLPSLLLVASALLGALESHAEERFITLATVSAAENSGLLDHLLPRFTERTGISVRVLAVGSGQAQRLARNGDADALLLNDQGAESALVDEGHAGARHAVMYNDFVIVGPEGDPAAIRKAETADEALARIAELEAGFISAGDGGGAHRKELALWTAAGIDPRQASGAWYRDSGLGGGAALHAANDLSAYSLVDRASWTAFANRAGLALLFDRDPALFNQYGLVLVNARQHPHVKAVEAQTFAIWLTSAEGQEAIADFRLEGQQLFFPNARRPDS